MKILKAYLDELIQKTSCNKEIIEKIKEEKSIYPFSVENKLLVYLVSIGEISYEEYDRQKIEYYERNKYLDLFDMAPRTYGQTWGENHILERCHGFMKATKKNLKNIYPNFNGEFDLWLDGIRVEVKACRANDPDGKGGLSSRAYSHGEAREKNFEYHYQQLKPSCCDVFIWIATCRDELIYWVLSSDEVRNAEGLCPQHRNENTGAKDREIFEGQIWMTEEQLEPFLVRECEIVEKVREKAKK